MSHRAAGYDVVEVSDDDASAREKLVDLGLGQMRLQDFSEP